jgi:hypothetical protein
MELLGERGKAADVGEQDRDVESLPARRSELVSERTEIGILPGGADLCQTKRQRAHAEKRHETFLDRDEKSSHGKLSTVKNTSRHPDLLARPATNGRTASSSPSS